MAKETKKQNNSNNSFEEQKYLPTKYPLKNLAYIEQRRFGIK